MSQKIAKKFLKIAVAVLFIIAAVILCLGAWLYTGTLTEAKLETFSFLPFPLALVNGTPIPVSRYIFRYKLTQTALSQGLLGTSTVDSLSGNVVSQLINEKKTDLLASRENVSVTQAQLDNEYNYESLNSNFGGNANFNDLLKNSGISQADYENQIIRPELLLVNLQTWFYSQQNLNQQSYSQANSLLQQIQNGRDMGSLAAANTQDYSGKETEGDLGFVSAGQILPELQETVQTMKVGDVKIIPSRYGLHILKLEAKSGALLDLRQIFLQGSSFKTWYNNETNSYKVIKIINPTPVLAY